MGDTPSRGDFKKSEICYLQLTLAICKSISLYSFHLDRPKRFFTETGLAACLLGLKTAEQVSRDPLRGNFLDK